MICFWALTMSHREGHHAASVYTNLETLMLYWGHKLKNHDDLQGCEIKQEYVSTHEDEDKINTVVCAEIFNNSEQRWVRHYFATARDVVAFQDHHMRQECNDYDFDGMMLKSLHICRD